MVRVVHLFSCAQARVVTNVGFEGCPHARPVDRRRQVLLVDIETLRAKHLTPGIIRENITTEGVDVNALQVGQKLRVGSVELEVSAVCEPCELMEDMRAALMRELLGRRGTLCRVPVGGVVRCGDEIVVCGGRAARDIHRTKTVRWRRDPRGARNDEGHHRRTGWRQ
jgi:MOSC domain-containing protein YiiM